MFISSQYLLTVIFLTIVTLTRSLPTKNVSDDISVALSSTFLRNYTSYTKLYCSQVDLNHYDDKFLRIYYACMELYDISLQLCEIKHDVTNDFGMVPVAKEFCKDLKFYDKRAEVTERFAGIAVNFLSNPANCEKVCISENSILPICQAIYLGNKFLINTTEERRAESLRKPVVHADVSATTQSQSNPTPAEPQHYPLSDHVFDGPESAKLLLTKSEKPKDTKEERKSEPVNLMEGESYGNKISEATITNAAQKSSLSVSKDDEQEKIPSEDPQPVMKPELDVLQKPVDDAGSGQQFPEQKHVDSGTRILGKQLSGGSQSSAPAIPVSSITPSAAPAEPFYKDSADDIRDSSKDAEMESEVTGDGDVGFKEDTGSSIITQEDSPNIYASVTGNKYSSRFPHAQDSHFFAYFLTMVVICIIGYLVFHNKQKIIALALEGRRMQGSRRRPNTSSYKKLDSNLEEAVTSNCSSSSVTHVIF